MDKTKAVNSRPPIVTVMGHVDHGKTTLLDAIRKTNVVAKEHGGITQHIGAYQITHNSQVITFIDTPGHAAFEKMRSRGAEVADIAVLVVAANDGVKPQTQEAIYHIKKAQKPLIVAITKVDLPDINIEKIKKQLEKESILVEAYGGNTPVVEVAAPNGKGITDLLEVINLVWQLSPEKAQKSSPLEAIVVESFLDKNRGPIVSVIVKKGTLKTGQKITVDSEEIKVRALIDDNGKNVSEAQPSKPVEILGFKKLLEVGSIVSDLNVTFSRKVESQKSISEIIAKSQEVKDKFKVIIKADVTGSLEAIISNIPDKIMVIAEGIGEVTLADVSFAKAAQAPILAFNVKVGSSVRTQAERENIIIKNYNLIYQLLSDLEDIALSFEQAKQELKITGRAKIVATFEVDGKKVAGIQITFGKIKIGDQVIVKDITDKKEKEAKISSLKKFKKDIQIASQGQECGIVLTPSLDFKVGDIIESLG